MNALGVRIVFMSLLQHEEIFSLETLNVIMPQARCCVAMGFEYQCVGVGTLVHLGCTWA